MATTIEYLESIISTAATLKELAESPKMAGKITPDEKQQLADIDGELNGILDYVTGE